MNFISNHFKTLTDLIIGGGSLFSPRLLPYAGKHSETVGKATQTSPVVHIHCEP